MTSSILIRDGHCHILLARLAPPADQGGQQQPPVGAGTAFSTTSYFAALLLYKTRNQGDI